MSDVEAWNSMATKAFENHFPDLRPYCDMTRDQLMALMLEASEVGDNEKWLMLEQFLLDTFSPSELEMNNLTMEATEFLLNRFNPPLGADRCTEIHRLVARMMKEIHDAGWPGLRDGSGEVTPR